MLIGSPNLKSSQFSKMAFQHQSPIYLLHLKTKSTKYINQYLRDYSCVERNTPLNEKRLVSILKNIIHQRIEIIWGCLD